MRQTVLAIVAALCVIRHGPIVRADDYGDDGGLDGGDYDGGDYGGGDGGDYGGGDYGGYGGCE